MLLKRFYDEKLAQASYLVGCQAFGLAAVIDPARDPEPYLRAAEEEGLAVVAVFETHIHADFLSGARELAERAGARLYLSNLGPAAWRSAFPHEPVVAGTEVALGKLRLRARATPGHTPEHVAWVLTDTAAGDEPLGMFSGDFLFVGDVGRPDLLERAAGQAGSAEEGARQLFASLRKLEDLPDHLQIWPGHGAGSACGKGLGALPQTTLGFERASNRSLRITDPDEFVGAILAGQPDPPAYFGQMKRLNKAGPAPLAELRTPPLRPARQLPGLLAEGALVLDLRPASAFANRTLSGAVNLPLNRSFPTWAGWLVPYDKDFYLITDRPEEARRDLASIGLDRVRGWFLPEAVEKLPGLGRILPVTPEEALRSYRILDVRWDSERATARIPGSLHIPLSELAERAGELAGDPRPLAVHCQSGARSAIAVSLLRRAGFTTAADLGGFTAWVQAGHACEAGMIPVISEPAPTR